jgi:hypothetical protein
MARHEKISRKLILWFQDSNICWICTNSFCLNRHWMQWSSEHSSCTLWICPNCSQDNPLSHVVLWSQTQWIHIGIVSKSFMSASVSVPSSIIRMYNGRRDEFTTPADLLNLPLTKSLASAMERNNAIA